MMSNTCYGASSMATEQDESGDFRPHGVRQRRKRNGSCNGSIAVSIAN